MLTVGAKCWTLLYYHCIAINPMKFWAQASIIGFQQHSWLLPVGFTLFFHHYQSRCFRHFFLLSTFNPKPLSPLLFDQRALPLIHGSRSWATGLRDTCLMKLLNECWRSTNACWRHRTSSGGRSDVASAVSGRPSTFGRGKGMKSMEGAWGASVCFLEC